MNIVQSDISHTRYCNLYRDIENPEDCKDQEACLHFLLFECEKCGHAIIIATIKRNIGMYAGHVECQKCNKGEKDNEYLSNLQRTHNHN